MSIADSMKDKMGDMDIDSMDRDTMMRHYDDLNQRDQRGDLDDKGQTMLSKLKERLSMGGM